MVLNGRKSEFYLQKERKIESFECFWFSYSFVSLFIKWVETGVPGVKPPEPVIEVRSVFKSMPEIKNNV